MTRPISHSQLVPAIFLVVGLLVASEGLAYLPNAPNRVEVSSRATVGANGSIAVSSELRSSLPVNLRVVDLLARPMPDAGHLFYYFDPAYAVGFSDYPDWFGLSQHLSAVAADRGFPLNLTVVTATGLELLLTDPRQENATIVLASGVLPATVFAPGLNLVTPWIARGGTMVWVGDVMGAYYSTAGAPGGPVRGSTPVPNGTSRVFDRHWLGGSGRFLDPRIPNVEVYTNPSTYAAAFGLDYPYALFNDGLRIANLTSSGGSTLGFVSAGYTNFGRIPIGHGSLVYFGAPVFDVIRLSYVLLNLYETGLSSGPVAVLGWQNVSVGPQGGASLASQYELGQAPVGGIEFCRVVLQTDYLGTLFDRHCFPPS